MSTPFFGSCQHAANLDRKLLRWCKPWGKRASSFTDFIPLFTEKVQLPAYSSLPQLAVPPRFVENYYNGI